MPANRLALALSPLACLAALACAEPDEPETYDPAEIVAEAVDFEANFERLDANGLITDHDAEGLRTAHIWANPIGAEVFRTLDPSNLDQQVEMPRGAIFLKESYDELGNPLAPMQIMAKFEAGYSPTGKDWFFAMVDREGNTLDGTIGKGPEVTFCLDCHDQMGTNTDLIIGLPPEELAP